MTNFSFRELMNDVTIIYALFLITLLLTYIAFHRRPESYKSK